MYIFMAIFKMRAYVPLVSFKQSFITSNLYTVELKDHYSSTRNFEKQNVALGLFVDKKNGLLSV